VGWDVLLLATTKNEQNFGADPITIRIKEFRNGLLRLRDRDKCAGLGVLAEVCALPPSVSTRWA